MSTKPVVHLTRAEGGFQIPNSEFHQAQAYASTRGSAPALSTPLAPTTMPAFDPWVQGPVTRSLWPRATSAWRVASGIRDSTDISPGYIVCGNGEAGKLRVDHRGASMAC